MCQTRINPPTGLLKRLPAQHVVSDGRVKRNFMIILFHYLSKLGYCPLCSEDACRSHMACVKTPPQIHTVSTFIHGSPVWAGREISLQYTYIYICMYV